jgi:hypothetical protein
MTIAQEMELAHWLALLGSDEPEQRCAAVSALNLLFADAPDVLPALVAALGDVDPAVRLQAAQALAGRADEAVPLLVAALQKEEREPIREALLNTLAYLGTAAKPAVPALAELLQEADQDPAFREALVLALGKLGPLAAAASPVLTALLADERLWQLAEAALARIQPQRGPVLRDLARRAGAWLFVVLFITALLGLAQSALEQAGLSLFSAAGGVAVALSGGCAVLGSRLGALTSAGRWGRVGMLLWSLALTLGGAVAGLLLGGVIAALVQPIVDVLGGR